MHTYIHIYISKQSHVCIYVCMYVCISTSSDDPPTLGPLSISSSKLRSSRISSFRRDREQDSDDSTSAGSIQRPSRRRQLSTDYHSQIASDTQYSGALYALKYMGSIDNTNTLRSSVNEIFVYISSQMHYLLCQISNRHQDLIRSRLTTRLDCQSIGIIRFRSLAPLSPSHKHNFV